MTKRPKPVDIVVCGSCAAHAVVFQYDQREQVEGRDEVAAAWLLEHYPGIAERFRAADPGGTTP